MNPYESNLIAVKVKGTTETTFLSATFKVKVTTQGKTGPEAKALATARIDDISRTIAAFSDRAEIRTDRLKTTFDVSVSRTINRHTNEQEFTGYQAFYTMTFVAHNVAEATNLHDALTSIVGVEAESPAFNVDERPPVYARAFQDAVDKARRKFSDQCAALGLDPTRFQVVNWVIEDRSRVPSKFLAVESTSDGQINVEPGRAVLELHVTFFHHPI